MPRKTSSIVRVPRCITIDFEGDVIKRRPLYPPKATGVAIKKPWEKKARYYSWGHPTRNNCTAAQGIAALKDAYEEAKTGARKGCAAASRTGKVPVADTCDGLLFQNGKFDIDVAETHYKMPRLKWDRYHELQFLLFLNNPHSHNLQLKSQAKELLGIEPEEKDEAVEWLKSEAKRTGVDPRPWIEGKEPRIYPDAPWNDYKGEKVGWYACVGSAPGDIVGRLAVGDITRTDLLFQYLYVKVSEAGVVDGRPGRMMEAYDRLRRFQLIALENEREGVCVDIKLLRADVAEYQLAMAKAEAWLRTRLSKKFPQYKKLNFNSDKDFAQALADNGLVDEDKWVYTKPTKSHPNGQRSVSKKNLTPDMVNDQRVAQVYGYRNRLYTCLNTFMLTWLRQAEATLKATGLAKIHTTWKLVKASGHGGEEGAATGRLSSSPNFQNIPKSMEDKGDGYVHPAFLKVRPLPLMRVYLLPDPEHVWGHADYDGQELRILAHFGDGAPDEFGDPQPGEMLEQYNTNPNYKVHKVVHEGMPAITGMQHTYQAVKNFDFQVVYGGGNKAVMAALKVDEPTAKKAMIAIRTLLPDYDRLNTHIKKLANEGGFITTWGGRVYYKEPDHYSEDEGRWMNFCYKLLNYLIQGSAGDCTIEALIRYHEHPKRQARFLITVHDEINISIPKHRVKEEMMILLECMESIEFDVLMKAEPKVGPRWSETKSYELKRAA